MRMLYLLGLPFGTAATQAAFGDLSESAPVRALRVTALDRLDLDFADHCKRSFLQLQGLQ